MISLVFCLRGDSDPATSTLVQTRSHRGVVLHWEVGRCFAEAVELAMGAPKGRHVAPKVLEKGRMAGRTTMVASIQSNLRPAP